MSETYPVPYSNTEVPPDPGADDVVADSIRESSGPTTLAVGAVANGEYLKRDGSTVVGDTPAGGGGVTLETPTGAVNGVNSEFVFSSPPIFVTHQKQIQDLTDDYTLVGSTITFIQPPVSGTVKGLVSA